MNLLSRHSDYAVQCLCLMFKRRGVVTVSEFCEELGLPFQFTRGILQRLAGANMIVSIRGKGGGFRTRLQAEELSVGRIAELFQGELRLTRCLFKKRACVRRSRCKLRSQLKDLERMVLERMDSLHIADLLG